MSHAAEADASRLARADGSCPSPSDASRGPGADVSSITGADASLRDPGDVSAPGPRADVSAAVEPDASLVDARRLCAWCRGPIPARARRDSVCCSKRCRQARHRFGQAAGRAAAASGTEPLRLAYADPPYPGKAGLYRGHPDYAGEVDHGQLIGRLSGYDGWALSTSAAALPAVLALCPPGVRVAAWHRGPRAARSWQPLPAWEPVIYVPGRPVDPDFGPRADSLVHGVSAMTTLPGRVIGAKPAVVCAWIFGLLGAAPGDTLDDLFPGSGAVSRAWAAWTADASLGDGHDPSCRTRGDGSADVGHDTSPLTGGAGGTM